jgi:hypothetical protein
MNIRPDCLRPKYFQFTPSVEKTWFRSALLGLAMGVLIPVFASSSFGASVSEVIKMEEITTFTFDPKPAGLTAQFQVGQPQFEIPNDMAVKLGGSSSGDLLKAPFENMLHGSGRFQVLMDRQGRYGIRAAMRDLKIESGRAASGGKIKPADIFKKVIGNLGGHFQMISSLTDVDWTKDDTKVKIQCGVTVQFFDVSTGALVLFDSSEVSKETTVKEIRAQMGGIELTKNGMPMQNLVEYQTKIVEYALHATLYKLMPKFDELLAKPQTEPPIVSSPQTNIVVASDGPGPKFCSQCGAKLTPPFNFCSGCGTKVVR